MAEARSNKHAEARYIITLESLFGASCNPALKALV